MRAQLREKMETHDYESIIRSFELVRGNTGEAKPQLSNSRKIRKHAWVRCSNDKEDKKDNGTQEKEKQN